MKESGMTRRADDYVVNNVICPEDGYWKPIDSSDLKEIKYFKKGQKFPQYKGKKTYWRMVSPP